MEHYLLEIMEGKRPASFVKPLLASLSQLYGFGLHVRHLGYQKGWLSSFDPQLPTVSIGNIVVGGTGKTPLVQKLAEELEPMGKIAILTRGFRSEAENAKSPLCIDKDHLAPAGQCGDEPRLLAEQTNAWVFVGKNRALSAAAAKNLGAACLILDDGFQHRRLKRNFDIIAVDANDPFGRGRLLPLGLLRDLPKRLGQADLIVATHVRDLEHLTQVKKELSAYTQAPIVAMQHELVFPASLKGMKVGAFCGIGKPHYFFNALKKEGAHLVAMQALLDHRSFSIDELAGFALLCKEKGACALVCTEKDAVKLMQNQNIQLPIHSIGMRLKIIAGQEHWDSAIETIKQIKVNA